MKSVTKKVVCAVTLCGVGLFGLIAFNIKPIAMYSMRPKAAFDPARLPIPPDYSDPSLWSALPVRDDAADVSVPALPAIDQQNAPADVFYIHPTTYIASGWNGPVRDKQLAADTDRVATKLQASAFNACCAIYAPRYRQANGTAFTDPSTDGEKALDVAFEDVRKAFHYYLEHHNHGRPFFIAGHSQGAALGYRLLQSEVSASPRSKQLIAAFLIGAAITEAAAARDLKDIPICGEPKQTGCLIAWNARGFGYSDTELEMKMGTNQAGPRVCVNPLSFRRDEEGIGKEQHPGAVFFDSTSPTVLPQFASAQCQKGTLRVTLFGKPPRDFMSKILDHVIGPENYHPIEYQLFFVNIRQNAVLRAAEAVRTMNPAYQMPPH